MRTMWQVLAGCVLAAGVYACSSDATAEQIRRHTYAREFRYYDDKELASAMGRLATQARDLNDTLKQDEMDEATRQQRVVKILDDMEKDAAPLRGGGRSSNHPRLVENIDRFIADVQLARTAASRTPPNYYLAGSVVGSCFHCHGAR